MSASDIGPYIFLGVVGLLIASAIAFQIYWTLSTHLIWASRIRDLLAREGFTVRTMERRWFTRGPFSDMRRLPGARNHREWLVRVIAEDREQRPRAGWVRWHRQWPWGTADEWAVRWDEEPWSGPLGEATAAPRVGLSTGVFMLLLLPLTLAGMGLGIYVLAGGLLGLQLRNPFAPQQTAAGPAASAQQPGVYEIRCRGGEGAFRLQQLSGGPRSQPTGEAWIAVMSLEFRAGPRAAGVDSAGLDPGTCAWIDRPLNDREPRSIRFDVPAIRTTGVPHTIFPTPGLSPDADYLRGPARYWSFFVFNTNQGYLQATSHRRLELPEAAPPAAPVARPGPANGEIVQRFVCERSYINFAWGYQHLGIYIDREGAVYRFSAGSRGSGPQNSSERTETEMEAKYGSGAVLVSRVPRDELLKMFRLIPAAAKGRYSQRVSAGADRGAFVSACYLFDSAGRYSRVELDVKGDWEYRNLAPEAQTLTKWLASLDPPAGKK